MARILITSGPTREYLDPVRFLSNASSGRMGAALAAACVECGHRVTVVSGPVSVTYPSTAEVIRVESTNEMLAACLQVLPSCDGVIAVAAPCDFTPRRFSREKIKKLPDSEGLVLNLIKTPDILTQLKNSKPAGWYVGFALETETGIANAVAKRRQKGCDLIVLNQPETIGSANGSVRLIDASDQVVAAHAGDKVQIAKEIVAWIDRNLCRRDP
ncbi:MAG: phosphopantothenoylcysteine decarboxylase [Planctomycetaceae bacterium]|nr:phosphopantothenoylcysteine decarboxylase [Planctomycetaceae bacterium]